MIYILTFKYICGFKSIKIEDIELINDEPIYMCCNDYKKALIHSITFNLKKHLKSYQEYSKFFTNNNNKQNNDDDIQIINLNDYDIKQLIQLYENIYQTLTNGTILLNHMVKICVIKQYEIL